MFEHCHSTSEVAAVYRGLGFTVTCSLERVFLIASATVGAIVMPADLGRAVRGLVAAESKHTTMPILTYPGPHREWVCLVGPVARGGKLSARTLADLEEQRVRIFESGQRVWLPTTDYSTGWSWITPPGKASEMPPRSTLISRTIESLHRARLSAAWT